MGGRRIDKIAEAVHIMECSVTLTIEQIESDQNYVAIRMTFWLVRKNDVSPLFSCETTMDLCLKVKGV